MSAIDDVYDGDDLDFDNIVQDDDIQKDNLNDDVVPDDDFLDDVIEDDNNKDNIDNNLVLELLKSKGIQDGKVNFLDEEENQTEVDFFELPIEEQLEILNYNSSNDDKNDSFQESELKFINSLRENNQTVEEYLEAYKEEIIKDSDVSLDYIYEIDNYDDKELFLLDQKAKYDLSDEELERELAKELENEDLFKKKVDKTREEYKQLEDQYKQSQQEAFEAEQQKKYEEFSNTLVETAVSNSEYHGIEIEDDEKNAVLGDLLELDESGASEFYKELNDPNRLFEAAWYLRYGKEAFKAIHDAYEAEISKLKKDTKPEPKVVKKNTGGRGNELTIHDI